MVEVRLRALEPEHIITTGRKQNVQVQMGMLCLARIVDLDVSGMHKAERPLPLYICRRAVDGNDLDGFSQMRPTAFVKHSFKLPA